MCWIYKAVGFYTSTFCILHLSNNLWDAYNNDTKRYFLVTHITIIVIYHTTGDVKLTKDDCYKNIYWNIFLAYLNGTLKHSFLHVISNSVRYVPIFDLKPTWSQLQVVGSSAGPHYYWTGPFVVVMVVKGKKILPFFCKFATRWYLIKNIALKKF